MPTEDTGAKVTSEKLIPLVKRSKRLRHQMGAKDNDTTLARIKLKHGVTIRPAWANSAASMATFPAKHCFGDEVDKYPERTPAAKPLPSR
jgi:phage terminase large subunit GpA-like protein